MFCRRYGGEPAKSSLTKHKEYCKHCRVMAVTGEQVYCSDKCRQAAYRNRRETPAVTKPESVTAKPNSDTQLGQLSRKQLKAAIDSYPEDTWKDSPEYRELIHRLHTKSIDELEAEGYWIPAWKANAQAGVAKTASRIVDVGASGVWL